jgi:hypothetical protein
MKVNSHRRRRPGDPPRTRRWSLLRVRDWRVPTKLSAVLVLPAVAFLVIAGVQINSSVASAQSLNQFAGSVKVGRQLTALIHLLQNERDHTAGVLASAAAGGPADAKTIGTQLAADYAATDAGLADFSNAAQPLKNIPPFSTKAQAVRNDFLQIRLVREGVKNRWLRQSAVFDQYSSMVQHLFDLVPTGPELGGDSDSTRNVQSLLDLGQVKELTAELRGRIFAACTAGTFGPDDFETFTEIQARQVAAVQRFRALATPSHLQRYDESLRGSAVSSVARLQETVISRARGTTVNVSAEEWWRSSTQELELIRYVEQDLLEDAIQSAVSRSGLERRNAIAAISVIALIMLLALLLSWLIGRSMARSLRQLRTQALDVAQHRLPEAINRLRTLPRGETITVDTTSRVQSSDEIGEVADAFTAVHRSAVSLAVEQAVMRRNVNAMFVNLARRSQTLVERQLQLLDSLEAAETDPDQLANLFRLDHLATRMRRNDENLLVLAGSDATRRWAQPVSLSAIVMAAMAEIEQYARIRHDVATDTFVVGHAVADIVHLLAELLENATTFSPPDSMVNVSGRPASSGKEATITIEDHGLGMKEGGLQEANDRVSTSVAIDVAASERMGLVVVGHLAARHGVAVRFTGSEKGVVAHVTLPAALLTTAPDGAGLYGSATGRLTAAAPTAPHPVIVRSANDVSQPPSAASSESGDEETTQAIAPPSRSVPSPGSNKVNGRPALPGPARAEAIIGAASGAKPSKKGSRWWSREGAAAAAAGPAQPAPGPRAPVIGGTSEVGLPMRVPMAQRPGATPASAPGSAASAAPELGAGLDGELTSELPVPFPGSEPDPAQVSSMLARFYSGVHRAATEDDVPTVPISEHIGARRDPEPTST